MNINFIMDDVIKKLKRLDREDLIWIIYFFIATFALLSNKLDRDFLLTKDYNAYKKEKKINISIFFVAFFIYLYFVMILNSDLNNMEKNFSNKKYRSTYIQLIAALLFLVGGFIYLFNELFLNDELDVGIIS